jgi:hypothetical protein
MLRAATARMGEEAVKGMVARTPLGGSERRLMSPMSSRSLPSPTLAGLLGKCSPLLADWPPKLKVNK